MLGYWWWASTSVGCNLRWVLFFLLEIIVVKFGGFMRFSFFYGIFWSLYLG